MRRILFLLLWLASPATANVIVTSGEHGPFTRIVLQFTEDPDWRFGRTETGYEVSLASGSPIYDLTGVFRLIDRQRLKTIWADPETGNLKLGLACACHAKVMTQGNRVLVIDIHDGPPDDIAYERTLAGKMTSPLGTTSAIAPRARPRTVASAGYDWTALPPGQRNTGPSDPTETSMDTRLAFQDFRRRLEAQLDKAGASGFVGVQPESRSQSSDIAIYDEQNFRIGPPSQLSEIGATCPNENDLGVANWSAGIQPAAELAEARRSILGEFDAINSSNLKAAIRTHLYFGFGAEARGMIKAFNYKDKDRDLLLALSYLVDGQPEPGTTFEAMHTCPGQTAIWAVAAYEGEAPLRAVNADGIVQAFLSLPDHLQRILAAEVTSKLLAANQSNAAETILNAMKRSNDARDEEVLLLAAEVAITRNDIARAESALEALPQGTETKRSLLVRAEAAFQNRELPEPALLTELAALYFTEGKGPDRAEITRAYAVATALSGDVSAALDLPGIDTDTTRDVWDYLSETGGDGALLQEVARIEPTQRDQLAKATVERVATRLLDLGLAALAEQWIGSTPVQTELRARVAAEDRDSRKVLALVSELPDDKAAGMRVAALSELGDFAGAAEVLAANGNLDEAKRFARWSGNFIEAEAQEGDSWSRLAAAADAPLTPSSNTTLAKASDLLDQTEQQLKDIEALLAETTLP